MAFDIRTARPIGEGNHPSPKSSQPLLERKSGRFDISTAKPVVGESLSRRDIPHIAAKAVSGLLLGVPEIAAKNPLSGIPGASARIGANLTGLFTGENIPEEPNLFPEPTSEAGERIGNIAEFATGIIPTSKLLSPLFVGGKNKAYGFLKSRALGQEKILRRPKVINMLQGITKKRGHVAEEQLSEMIKKETDVINQRLSSASRDSALEAQKVLPKYFSKRSREYGNALDNLIETHNPKITRLDVSKALEKTLEDSGIRGPFPRQPSGPIEKAIFDMAEEFSRFKKLKGIIPAKKILALKRQIQKSIPSTIRGGTIPYSSEEHIITSFGENFGELLENTIPGLKKLNSSYRPFIQLKRKAVKIFKPFSGEFETKGGESIIKKFATGKLKGTGEEEFLKQLQKESGKRFTGQPQKIGYELGKLKESGSLAEAKIKNLTEQRLGELGRRKELAIRESEKLEKNKEPLKQLGKFGRYLIYRGLGRKT